MTDALSTLTVHFDAMHARVSAARERLANGRVERQRATVKRERLAARRAAAGTAPVALVQRPIPAPEQRNKLVGAWERATYPFSKQPHCL